MAELCHILPIWNRFVVETTLQTHPRLLGFTVHVTKQTVSNNYYSLSITTSNQSAIFYILLTSSLKSTYDYLNYSDLFYLPWRHELWISIFVQLNCLGICFLKSDVFFWLAEECQPALVFVHEQNFQFVSVLRSTTMIQTMMKVSVVHNFTCFCPMSPCARFKPSIQRMYNCTIS